MKKVLLLVISCLASVIFWAGGAWGEPAITFYCVDPGSGGTHTTLQTALNSAQVNIRWTIIQVVQGTYTGNFTYSSIGGHNISLAGGYTAGCASQVVNPANTILDGNNTGKAIYFSNTNGGSVRVEGFTMRHGNSLGSGGGGISASTDSDFGTAGTITLTNNIISENTASYGGGLYASANSTSGVAGNVVLENNTISGNTVIIYWGGGGVIYSSSPTGTAGTITLTNNTISGNTSTGNYGGGGLYIDAHSAAGTAGAGDFIFTNNTITGNTAGGGGGIYASTRSDSGTAGTVTITSNIIAGNTATSSSSGGVYAYSNSTTGTGGTVTFTNNTITGNTASDGGGILLNKFGNTINFYNNIVWGNTAPNGGDIYLSGSTGTFNGYNNDYNEIYGGWDNSGGNIYSNPLFVDASVSDYHLSATSPCFGAGDGSAPGVPSTDFEGDSRTHSVGTLDMGADEYTCANYPFKIGGTISSYASIHAAYEAMSSGNTLQIHSLENTENLVLDINKTVTLKGGYGCGFSTNPGYTRVKGSLTISGSAGKVTVENIKIK
jgi:hypothetical protein